MNHLNKESDIKRIISANPLLPITILFSSGIVIGHAYNSILLPITAIIIAIIFGLLKKTIYVAWTVSFALGTTTIFLSYSSNPTNKSDSLYSPRYYEATIESAAEYDNTQSATLKIVSAGESPEHMESCRPISVRLATPTFEPTLIKGHSIVFKGKLEPIEPITDLPDEWTPEQSLLEKNIRLRVFVEPDNIVDYFPTKGIVAYFQRCQKTLVDHLFQTNLTTSAKEFIATALLGDSSGMSQSTRDEYANAGLSHILALSGLHVGLIAMIVSIALWPLRTFGYRKSTSVIVILILWIYAATTGLSASVIRATVMMTIYIVGQMLQRPSSSINSLSAAALIILIFDPTALFSIGFQLSFAAVLSIILFADIINPFQRRQQVLYTLASYPAITISAMIGTGLISAVYFHSFPLYFIFANIAASLLLPPIIAGGLIIIIISLFGAVPTFLAATISLMCSWLESVADFFAKLPGSTIDDIYLPNYILLIYAAVIASTILWLKKRKTIYGFVWGISVIILVGCMLFHPQPLRTPGLYVARTTFRTDIVIDNSTDTLYLLSTRPQEPINVTSRAQLRYRDYMGKRNIRALKLINASDTVTHGFAIHQHTFSWGKKKILWLYDQQDIPNVKHTDYALICRGYRNTINNLTDLIDIDTIIFSYDLDPRRTKKYINECEDLKQPYINLRERGVFLPYESD